MLRPGTRIRFRLAAILLVHWEAFLATNRKWVRPIIFETVRKIIACRTPALGCHVYRCPQCGKIEVVPHSCKSRFCPSCGKLATDRWADGVLNELLDVPYHHLVMSPPWQLRPLIAFNREAGLNRLVRSATGCLTQWARDQHGMRMGIVTVIHTFGSDLKWHPHVHLLVTEGGLSLDGRRWVRPYKLGWLMSEAGVKKMWRYHCVTAFRQAHRAGELRWEAKSAFLKKYPLFSKFLSTLYEMTWYVHIGAALLDPGATVRYIGRYTKRAVLAEYRITAYDGKLVRFSFRDYAQGGKTSYKTLPVLAFIGRLIRHIPDKGFKMVRHAGLFAPRWKARHLGQARALLAQETPGAAVAVAAEAVAEPTSMLSWRERRTARGEEDPLVCSTCKVERELVGEVFGSHAAVASYFEMAKRATAPFHPAFEPSPG
jgi:hypothetical protein